MSRSHPQSGVGDGGKGSVIFNMSQISVRSVHLLRWLLIVAAVLGFAYVFYWHRSHLQAEANRRLGIGDIEVPSLKNVGPEFILGKVAKKLRILSGSFHYFRVVPEYWEDRLLKMKACGLNTITTYVPWNMHEQVRGEFDFSGQLDIVAFLNLAKKVGLHVILRPGPYICAEWDLGGLPSWLLSYDEMKLRSMYPLFVDAVDKYFDQLLPLVAGLQHYRGGPIIAFQVENEYGSYGSDKQYMTFIKEAMEKRNLKEMFLTSDNSRTAMKNGHLPDVLVTANFQVDAERHFQEVKEIQGSDKPLMVMEFWSGWFDHWGEKHHVFSSSGIADLVKTILDLDASINFYMFHGGTNFGFMNGANVLPGEGQTYTYAADVTSYDYDAPLSEAGDLTEKYYKVKDALKANTAKGTIPDNLPSIPTQIGKMAYGDVKLTHYMTMDDAIEFIGKPITTENPVAMEKLPINQNGGQGYGFLLYRTNIDHKPETLHLNHPPHDRAQVFLNSKPVGVMTRVTDKKDTTLALTGGEDGQNVLELFVENMGRVNYGDILDHERKGILGGVQVDGKPQTNWDMFPFEFKKPFLEAVSSSSNWKEFTVDVKRPALYKGVLEINDKTPKDTFVDMTGWEKGVIFINGFNLGRYWNIGPTTRYYLPGPLLKNGKNEIIIFELHHGSDKITLTDKHSLGEVVHVTNDEDIPQ
ncbi:beta-galactosidase-1-like protein 2 [Asterias rubens]|uniref:beta-galactosidase-1-like protein 2 n=1 Tax=Asterias rubens TaxID=7604 RepID=UPI001455880D|nr:beta-galactosidase-1-like protein 2 [Asterias rubens]